MRPAPFNAARYVGIAYRSREASLEGCDCWGLVRLVYREEFAIELRPLAYADAGALAEVAREVALEQARPEWAEVAAPSPGDVVVFRMAGLPTHVGVTLEGARFLHCFQGRAACIERLAALVWAHRIAGFHRWAA